MYLIIQININGEDINFDVKFDYTAKTDGVYSGHPDHRQPEEPHHIDIISVKTMEGDDCSWISEYAHDDIKRQIEEFRKWLLNSL